MDNRLSIEERLVSIQGFEDRETFNIPAIKIVHLDYQNVAQRNANQCLDANWKKTSGAVAIAALSNIINLAQCVLYLGREITVWSNVTVATMGFGIVVLLGNLIIDQIANKTLHPFLRTLAEISITVLTTAVTNLIVLSTITGIPLIIVVCSGAGMGAAIYIATKIVGIIIQRYHLKALLQLQSLWGKFAPNKIIWGHFDNHDLISLKLPKSVNLVELVENYIPLIGSSRIYMQDKNILCLNNDSYIDVTDHPFFVKNKNAILEFLNNKILELNNSKCDLNNNILSEKGRSFEKQRILKSINMWKHIASG